MTKSPPQWVYAQEPDDDDGGMAEALLEKVARAIRDLLDAYLKRTEQLHDLLSEARETVRKRLEPSSPQEDRDLYEKLNTSLYSLRGDPFDMHIRAALSVIENEMMLASASASPSLGKDQVQSEASRHVVPPGYVLVPREPTEGMLWKGWDARKPAGTMEGLGNSYRAMISAAPQNPSEGGEK